MKKALHIFAVNGKSNSGDFFLGPATKHGFEALIKQSVSWTNFDVRKVIQKEDIDFINKFDYVVIGGGGLLLPDTNPNKISCWQWACHYSLLSLINAEIHVFSIGWNHFYNQKITMPNRNNDLEALERSKIFKKNMETLIEKSKTFTMRHKGDCEELKKHINANLHSKIKFLFCPVIKYVKENYRKDFKSGEYITFEIKDDRPNRRYFGTSRGNFYGLLYSFILNLNNRGEKIAIMSHDGSATFINYLRSKGFHNFIVLNNTVANEKKIIKNYSSVKTLYCTAGHSQMTAYALGLDNYSLIGHDKLFYFLQDTQRETAEHGSRIKDLSLETLLKHFDEKKGGFSPMEKK